MLVCAEAKHGDLKQAATQMARAGKMQEAEAREILNLAAAPATVNLREVHEQYERYFEANDPDKGGSFYLQSKIYRAKEAMETAEKEREEIRAGTRAPPSSEPPEEKKSSSE